MKNDGSIINIIFVLYFIVLYEFYPSKLYEIEQYEMKIDKYISALYSHLHEQASDPRSLKSAASEVNTVVLPKAKKVTFADIGENLKKSGQNFLPQILTLFTPHPKEYFHVEVRSIQRYLEQFEHPDNEILLGFCRFLVEHIEKLKTNKDEYRLWDLFEMTKTIL